ncbi:tetratricopeptide repeat protein [Aestuariibacter salexigens]|uniref:tetratricopeptide repeat protein n=1 Tax=Aestuariibacter salexigens TaxID=226010 RepID=UPI000416DCAE|nr:tetratricopeptide repeat protein [Aestuariibacter salexigens]
MKRFFGELQRRGVIKTLVAYIGLVWLVMQVVEVVSGLIDVHEMVGPTTVIVFACLLPVVLYISWYFEWHEGSMRRTVAIDSGKLQPLGFFSWFGLVTVLSFSSYLGYDFLTNIAAEKAAEAEGQSQIKQAESIAVLPFTDQSPEKDQGYLAVGLAEELTSLLGRSEGFRVAASRSSQILAEKGLPPVDIGKRLDVETVLTGSVRATGSRLKIRVELLDTETGHTLWTENFLRELKDIFELESEIGRAVINLLQDKYLEAGSFKSLSSTSSTDAYVMYLKGREEYRKQTTESMKQARKLFEQAIALDPEYAQGYVGLADTIALLGDGPTQFGVLANDVSATLAEQNVEKALVREPNMAEAYAILGYIAMIRSQYEGSLSAFDKAIELNPSLAVAYMWKYRALYNLNRYEESFAALQKATELDPLAKAGQANLGWELSRRGKTEEALKIYQQLINDFPDYNMGYEGVADVSYSSGDLSESVRYYLKAADVSPDDNEPMFRVVDVLLELGMAEYAGKLVDRESDDYKSFFLVREGRYDDLFDYLEFQLKVHPDDPYLTFEYAYYQLMFGDFKIASKYTEIALSNLDDDFIYLPHLYLPAMQNIFIKKQLGETQEVIRALAELKEKISETDQAGWYHMFMDYSKARVYYLESMEESSLESFENAFENGWRQWWTRFDPIMKPLFESNEKARLLLELHDEKIETEMQETLLLPELQALASPAQDAY